MKSAWQSLGIFATLFLFTAEPSLARNVVRLESPIRNQPLVSGSLHNEVVLSRRQNAPVVAAPNPPADGKDGKPHDGPFVETAGDRERKLTGEKEEIKFSGKLPYTNDGVMDDKSHKGPEVGKSGTEGGVTAKTTEQQTTGAITVSDSMKKPSEPKEAPPLPHSEQEQLEKAAREDWNLPADAKVPAIPGQAPETSAVASTSAGAKKADSEEAPGGFKIPVGLPDTPHDIPHPVPDSATQADNHALASSRNSGGSIGSSTLINPSEPHIIQPFHSFVLSFTMILFSEVGDKTFLVAALMAMKHSGMIVFSAAFAALAIMTVLSAVLGQIVPTLLTTKLTSFAAAILFLVFGAKMLREGLVMSPDEGVGSEMREVELELEEAEAHMRKHGRRKSSALNMDNMDLSLLEAGRQYRPGGGQSRVTPPESPPSPDSRDMSPNRGGASNFKEQVVTGVRNLFGLLFTEAWVQTFIMTFLGEWGDRSQIATIAMAAGDDWFWVTIGAFTGHSLCTAAAVVGGRALAGRVSLRIVTLGGAIAFLVFGVIYAIQGVYGGK